ncbi:MAG: MarR family transcriptional regulator [Propionibacteriaceae bacterium]|nr:MarR family transcriptional regulator [Propionibacteriaceae bacterium]
MQLFEGTGKRLYDATMRGPDDQLSSLIRQVVRLVGMLERHGHGGIEASASELFALDELDGGPLTQTELGNRLGLEKSTVSRLAAALEKRGWVARERDPGNRRLSVVTLSQAGRSAAGQAAEHLHRQHARLVAALSQEERAALEVGVGALSRVLSRLPEG